MSLHTGTDDVDERIIKLARKKNDDIVMISEITPWVDTVSQKAIQVNFILAEYSNKRIIVLIKHNMNGRNHRNKPGLPLNRKGADLVIRNFKFKNFFADWQKTTN